MSTFNGLFEEIPFISADQFEAHNLKSKLFFLSHCHSDHMMGLSSTRSLPGPLYTSAVSAVFLRKQFPNLSDLIHVLDIETPVELTYDNEGITYTIVVTTLPAQHCPGSVMFLFETQQKTILYTGDFRLALADLKKRTILSTKSLDVAYIDSTFLDPIYSEFPTQLESVREVCKLIADWLERSETNKIVLEVPAQYGYEFLFMNIWRKLNQKTYCKQKQFEKYIFFPQMDECISNDNSKCRIFTKFKNGLEPDIGTSPSGSRSARPVRIRTIKVSAQFWRFWSKNKPFVLQEDKNVEVYRVAYSNHSSYTEIKNFLDFTKPKKVQLNVANNSAVYRHLDEIYKPPASKRTANVSTSSPSFRNIFIPPKRKRLKI